MTNYDLSFSVDSMLKLLSNKNFGFNERVESGLTESFSRFMLFEYIKRKELLLAKDNRSKELVLVVGVNPDEYLVIEADEIKIRLKTSYTLTEDKNKLKELKNLCGYQFVNIEDFYLGLVLLQDPEIFRQISLADPAFFSKGLLWAVVLKRSISSKHIPDKVDLIQLTKQMHLEQYNILIYSDGLLIPISEEYYIVMNNLSVVFGLKENYKQHMAIAKKLSNKELDIAIKRAMRADYLNKFKSFIND